MTPVLIRASIAVIALTIPTAWVAAQESSPAILNAAEVQQLATRGHPADHERLSVHFLALAERYAAEARTHAALGEGFGRNPNRNLDAGASAHFRQLVELNTSSASTLRDLAAYHRKLAAGATATPPAGGSRFESGAGATRSTEMHHSAAQTNTPAEDRGLQEYFATLAKRYKADADEHARLAQAYRGTRLTQVAANHERLAQLAREAAKHGTAAATMYEQLANIGR